MGKVAFSSRKLLRDRRLEEEQAIALLHLPEKSISVLQKPDKIFLNNPNLYYVLNPANISVGSMRETFFQSQLNVVAEVSLHPKTDFLVDYKDQQYAFEVGGSNKKTTQIQQLNNAFLALDDIETGFSNHIPLWLFGFLY